MKQLDEFEVEFIEYTGLAMQADGLPKIAGRIFGLLIISDDLLSFSSIAETLQVSRGSVSTNTRLLESLGIARRVSLMGERQDYFRLPDNPYSSLIEGFAGRTRNYLRALDKTLNKAPEDSFAWKRLKNHKTFYETAQSNSELLIKELKEIL
ncbi:GbsR/MarR family transcriptional regulator [Arenicella xantha]|uniref:DNA-binding transcriptional regulator GbsR (MarR family) n=1 Tax=Arenicella xantha TaxID=644221 RepID=A0A395JLB6_9GAMM|nr:transcriptional regulator [Arenicella xantha]RBP50637.1 DNA-binding transcriptional regulator GbsR (MarR family) [Arenicella xantha]